MRNDKTNTAKQVFEATYQDSMLKLFEIAKLLMETSIEKKSVARLKVQSGSFYNFEL